MKKIFIIASILAFFFASAQQNELFDIQKHVQQKIKDEINQKQKEQLLSLFKPKMSTPFLKPIPVPQMKILESLPNGDKVYILPEDNMPCIVPDMSQFNKADLAGLDLKQKYFTPNRNFPGKIPNPVTPFKFIPEQKER